MVLEYEKKVYEDIELFKSSINDRKSFLIDFMEVSEETVDLAIEKAEKAFYLGKYNKEHAFVGKDSVKIVVEHPKLGLGLRKSHMLYKEFYGLVYDHFLIRSAMNKINKPTTYFKIGKKEVGENNPTFIIAELSANHMNDFDIAVKTIEAMAEAGADAVKFQTFTPDTITIDCDNEHFQIKQGTVWDGRVLHELYEDAYMPWDWQPKLKKIAEDLGLIVFSSPFDKTSVDFLEEMDVPAYKIASFEITDIPLIGYVASKGKPIIISTGIASLEDIELAVKTCLDAGNDKIALLKCTSSYPAPLEEINLNTIPDIKNKFNVIVGLSDHTLGGEVSTAAIAVGANIIEKHFILDRNMGGPDSEFSMEPDEFKQMVDSIRNVEKALGKISYELSDNMKVNREFSRSLFVVEDMKKGDMITEDNVRSIRPGFGLHPKYLNQILGKKVNKDLKKGSPFKLDYLGD